MKLHKATGIFLLSTLLTFKSFANPGGEETEVSNTGSAMGAQIIQMVSYPEFALQLMGTQEVVVKFDLDENNSIHILSTDGTDGRLAAYVKTQLNGKKVRPVTNRNGNEYQLKLVFK